MAFQAIQIQREHLELRGLLVDFKGGVIIRVQFQSAVEVGSGLYVRVHGLGGLRGLHAPGNRVAFAPGAFEVAGNRVRCAPCFDQIGGQAAVRQAAAFRAQAIGQAAPHQIMRKTVAIAGGFDHLPLECPLERLEPFPFGERGRALEHVRVKRFPGQAGRFQVPATGRTQAFDAGQGQLTHAGRQGQFRVIFGGLIKWRDPTALLEPQGAIAEQPAQGLEGEQRVAARGLEQPSGETLGAFARERLHQ